MYRKEYIERLKQELLASDIYDAASQYRAEFEDQIAHATYIGDLFEVMQRNGFVVSDAVAIALKITVEGTFKEEFYNVPINGWDT